MSGRNAVVVRGLVCGVVMAAIFATPVLGDRYCPSLPETTSEGAPSASLLSMLGVFRRAQTAEDTLPAPVYPGGVPRFGEGIYAKYVRLARVFAGTKYYLVPVARATDSLPQCTVHEGVYLMTAEAGSEGHGFAATPEEIEQGKLSASFWFGGGAVTTTTYPFDKGIEYGVVPDDVAKVTLRSWSPRGKHGRPAVDVTVKPEKNVYVARLPGAASGFLRSHATTIIWRSRNGSIIKILINKSWVRSYNE